MDKIKHECEHACGNDLCSMCEFNDKPCPFEDVLECDICREEYEADKTEIRANDYD